MLSRPANRRRSLRPRGPRKHGTRRGSIDDGGCGDDGFIDFRSCLISLGKQLFFQVLNDADSLADIVDRPDAPYLQAEGFQYVAPKVYEEKTGGEMPQGKAHGPTRPAGSRIDHDDEEVMRRHFPKIVARFPDMGD